MSVIDELITDRTSADVAHANGVVERITNGTATPEDFTEYIQTEMRGRYGMHSLNRVGNAIIYVADHLNEISGALPISVSAKTDWTISDEMTAAQRESLLSDLRAIRSVYVTQAPAVPFSLVNLTYNKANDIEKILKEVDRAATNVQREWTYSAEIYSGEYGYCASASTSSGGRLGTAKLGELILGG